MEDVAFQRIHGKRTTNGRDKGGGSANRLCRARKKNASPCAARAENTAAVGKGTESAAAAPAEGAALFWCCYGLSWAALSASTSRIQMGTRGSEPESLLRSPGLAHFRAKWAAVRA